jgi:hypothetical protein
MDKCYWCGAENDKSLDICHVCRRKLEWSHVIKALLKPSHGHIGNDYGNTNELAAKERTLTAV